GDRHPGRDRLPDSRGGLSPGRRVSNPSPAGRLIRSNMPGSSRKTRERQLAKLAARRAAVRRHQRNRRLVALVVVLVVALAGMGFGLFALTRHGKKPAAAPTPPPATPTPAPSPGSDCGYHAFQENTGKIGAVPIPTFTIDVNKAYTATMRTSEGTITLQLLPKAAPCTVNSFVYLAKRGFFDGLTFHRV